MRGGVSYIQEKKGQVITINKLKIIDLGHIWNRDKQNEKYTQS